MKKKMIAILAGALLTVAMSGNAFAYFGTVSGNQFDLVRVVYDSTGAVEVGTDLGNVATFTASNAASNFSLSQFGAGKTFDNLNVAYFAYDNVSHQLWISSTAVPNKPTVGAQNTTSQAAGTISAYYNTLATSTGTVIADQTNAAAYFGVMDKGGAAVGSMDALLSPQTGEANLGALATTGYTDITLYNMTVTGSGRTASIVTNPAMVLRTNADGSTTLAQPAATPIPPAFFLMGSGLLGMVGLRRKKA